MSNEGSFEEQLAAFRQAQLHGEPEKPEQTEPQSPSLQALLKLKTPPEVAKPAPGSMEELVMKHDRAAAATVRDEIDQMPEEMPQPDLHEEVTPMLPHIPEIHQVSEHQQPKKQSWLKRFFLRLFGRKS